VRKGPYQLFDLMIDTEWRSDYKWDRLLPHLPSLSNKRLLDVGCGSGYHMWRMLGAGAKEVIGIDPTQLFLAQFLLVRKLMGEHPVWFLPLGLEHLPVPSNGAFDVVFSMGVLYHRRSPIDHLLELKAQLKPGGTLVLETLVVPEGYAQLLVPKDRYAQMKNVWFIPSVPELTRWLHRCGFKQVRCVDLDQTSTEEQRTTAWSKGQSLTNYLDPENPDKTVEGYPAPLRAILLAEK
jgi:tRNA (mo5U34)-methyltransferase